MRPIVDQRRREMAVNPDPAAHFDDCITWYETFGRSKIPGAPVTYDAAAHIMGLSFASNMTTTDLVMQSLFDLCRHPEHVDALRQEAISLTDGCGTGSSSEPPSVPSLRLLDSAMKESSRIKPIFRE